MQISLVDTAPIIEIEISGDDIFIRVDGTIIINRATPYPPNFRRIAARTIDPAIGASTCALGSHRWVENNGNLTRNPKINIAAINVGHSDENIV